MMTLPFNVPLTNMSWIKGDWIDLHNNIVNAVLKVTLPAIYRGEKRAGCESWSIKNCWGLAWSLSKTKLEVLHKSIPALCIPHTSFMLWNDRMECKHSFFKHLVSILQVNFKEITDSFWLPSVSDLTSIWGCALQFWDMRFRWRVKMSKMGPELWMLQVVLEWKKKKKKKHTHTKKTCR